MGWRMVRECPISTRVLEVRVTSVPCSVYGGVGSQPVIELADLEL